MWRICVDPGHGGQNDGCDVGGVREADYVLEIAGRLTRVLMGDGYQVLPLRMSDQGLSLAERGRMSMQYRADLVVVLHVDAPPSDRSGALIAHWHGNDVGRGIAQAASRIWPLPCKALEAVHGEEWREHVRAVLSCHTATAVLFELFNSRSPVDLAFAQSEDGKDAFTHAIALAIGRTYQEVYRGR